MNKTYDPYFHPDPYYYYYSHQQAQYAVKPYKGNVRNRSPKNEDMNVEESNVIDIRTQGFD